MPSRYIPRRVIRPTRYILTAWAAAEKEEVYSPSMNHAIQARRRLRKEGWKDFTITPFPG